MTVSPPVHPADPTEIHRRLEVAVRAAREAGDLVLRRFRRPDLAVEWKSDASPVTIADREAEAHLRRSLEAAFPRDGILGEELGETTGTSGYRWILDPVDAPAPSSAAFRSSAPWWRWSGKGAAWPG